MKNPFGNMANIMKQAQAMQAQMAKLQEEAATKTVTGSAGGGMVTVTANGAMELVSIVIDPAASQGWSLCRLNLGTTPVLQPSRYMQPDFTNGLSPVPPMAD